MIAEQVTSETDGSKAGNVVHVDFRGDTVDVIRNPTGIWVSVRRVCDALKIAYSAQLQKLNDKPWATVSMIDTVAEDGKMRAIACIHLDSLPMWLATIDTNRVAPESRDKLVAYQTKCAAVLRNHFLGGVGGDGSADGQHGVPVSVGRLDSRGHSRAEESGLPLEFDKVKRGEQVDPNALGAGALLYQAVFGAGSLVESDLSRHELALRQLESESAVLAAAVMHVEQRSALGTGALCRLSDVRRVAQGMNARATAALRVAIDGWR